MRETLSESQIIEYEQKADEMIKLIAWISIASLIILIIGEVEFSDSRTLSKWYALAVLIFFQVISLLWSYWKFYPMIRQVQGIKLTVRPQEGYHLKEYKHCKSIPF